MPPDDGATTSPVDAVPAKPIPVVDEASRPFFDGALRGLLMLRRCRACGTFMWPVAGIRTPLRPRCVECFSGDLEWAPSSGKGTLYSFAIMHQVYDPAFAAEIPYNVSIIELEEGVRMTCTVVDCPNDDLRIGMPLEVIFEKVSDDIAIPKFKPSA